MSTRRQFIAAGTTLGILLVSGAGPAGASYLTVDAGQNQTIKLDASAQLKGTVVDTAPPAASIGWTLQSGPGEVEFDDQHSAVTSARFSAPGEYVLMLGGYDGDIAWDTVVIRVEP